MSLFQATTQIQESTLSVVPKLCAAVLALVIAGPWIGGQLTRFTTQLLRCSRRWRHERSTRSRELELLAPHMVAVALCARAAAAGGLSLPPAGRPVRRRRRVKLALVLALALSVHFAGGVDAPRSVGSACGRWARTWERS